MRHGQLQGKIMEQYKDIIRKNLLYWMGWKSMVKIEHFKIFMGKNKHSIKVKFLSFSPKYEI